MAIGRTFKEAFQKGLRALEIGPHRLGDRRTPGRRPAARTSRSRRCAARCAADARADLPGQARLELGAVGRGDRRADRRSIPGSSHQMRGAGRGRAEWARRGWRDADDASTLRRDEADGLLRPAARRPARRDARPSARDAPLALGVRPAYKMVDTCAGEFPSATPYLYCIATTRRTRRRAAGDRPVVILGSGPNRIGQGVEFDYCCVRAAMALREHGLRDDHGQLEPRDGLHRLRHLRHALLRAADARGRARDRAARAADRRRSCSSAGRRRSSSRAALEAAGVRILGTSPDAIDAAEDRGRFEAIARELGRGAAAERHGDQSVDEAVAVARADRLSGARAALVRARRPRDADRLRRRVAARATSSARPRGRPRTPGADRPLPRGRVRGRRRRDLRRRRGA